MKRPGFTFTELMLTVAIVASATAIGVPKLDDLKRRSTAAQILREVDVIRHGTFRFYSDSGYFPPDAPAGVVPEGLIPYLPRNFTFNKKNWTIDFEYWARKSASVRVKTKTQIGVSITTRDAKLGATAMGLFDAGAKFAVGSKYTFMLVGL